MSTWKGFTSRTTPRSAIDNYVAQATYLLNEPHDWGRLRLRDETIHDDGRPCRFIAGACNLCGAREDHVRAVQLAGVPLTEGTPDTSPGQDKRPASRRGTTNVNARGNTEDRRKRREWLVETYRADVDVLVGKCLWPGVCLVSHVGSVALGSGIPACRCYRCGELLTAETVTVDRIKPGCRGGTYRRDNIRPACGRCNSETGGAVRGRR